MTLKHKLQIIHALLPAEGYSSFVRYLKRLNEPIIIDRLEVDFSTKEYHAVYNVVIRGESGSSYVFDWVEFPSGKGKECEA